MRKRSKYRPRLQLADPVGWVLGGLQALRDRSEALALKIKNHQALAEVAQGSGSRAQVDILIAAMNMAEALARVNPDLGADYAKDIREAQDALLAMSRRGIERSRFLLTGPELQAMNVGMEVHDAQLDACNIRELDKALALVKAELRAKRARLIAPKEVATP